MSCTVINWGQEQWEKRQRKHGDPKVLSLESLCTVIQEKSVYIIPGRSSIWCRLWWTLTSSFSSLMASWWVLHACVHLSFIGSIKICKCLFFSIPLVCVHGHLSGDRKAEDSGCGELHRLLRGRTNAQFDAHVCGKAQDFRWVTFWHVFLL